MKRLLIALFAVFPTIALAGMSIQTSGSLSTVGILNVSSLTVNNQTTLKSSVTFVTGSENVSLFDGKSSGQDALYLRHSGNNPRLIWDNPTVRWAIDTNSNNLQFEEVGATGNVLSLKTGGNVGIGTANQASKLDVNGSASFGSGATKSTFTSTGNLQFVSHSTITGNGSIALSSAPTADTASNVGLTVSTMGAVYLGSRINAPLSLHTAGARVSGLAGNGGGAMFSVTDNAGTSKFDIDSCSGIGVCLNTPAGATMAMRIGGTTIAQFDTAGGRPFVALSQTDCNLETPTQIGSLCVENSATCPISVSTGTGAGQWACISISATQGP